MPSYCNWHSGTVHLDDVEYTCHSDKEDFIFLAKDGKEVRVPGPDALALRNNLNHYLMLGEGYAAHRNLQLEQEHAKVSNQLKEAKHRLQTMRGVLEKTLKALN